MTDTATAPEGGAAEALREGPLAGAPFIEAPFIEPVPMEEDPDGLFPGDRGVLAPEVRRVLVHLLQRRFLAAERNRQEWTVLLDHQQVIESRLNDLYVRLVIDHARGIAYKQQVRSDEVEVPILLRDVPYTRSETLVLVHLRTVYQRESAAGEPSARVDVEDIEQTVLSYFAEGDGGTARRQRAIRKALDRLARDGIVTEESAGRFRISPLVEVVLSAERLHELREWLRTQALSDEVADAEGDDDTDPDADEAGSDEEDSAL